MNASTSCCGARGCKVNRKRVHRLYRLEGLQMRMRKRRRKRLSLHRSPAPRPTVAGERWSMDFVRDQLANGQALRVLTVVDNCSREGALLETGFRLTGDSVARALSGAGMQRTLPHSITVDHGTEFTFQALEGRLLGPALPLSGKTLPLAARRALSQRSTIFTG